MRLIVAAILAQSLFVNSLTMADVSGEQQNSKSHQNKNSALVMVSRGEIIKKTQSNDRSELAENLSSFQTIEERKIAQHNQKRLDLYKSKLLSYEPPREKLEILVTGYSSTLDQTWGDPFTTASGTKVHKGTLACPPQYPFGTKVKIEGRGSFVCEDRGGSIKYNHFDMWFESRIEALNWGKQIVSAEIVK